MSVFLWGVVAALFMITFSKSIIGFASLAIGFGGTPGQLAAERVAPGNGAGLWACFAATVVGQLAVALAWAAFLAGSTANWLAAHPSGTPWALWVAAFLAAAVPAHWASQDDGALGGTMQADAAAWTAVLADLGFLGLVARPDVREALFGWLPVLFG